MTLTPNRSVAELTVSLPVAKLGEFRTVLGGYLTQGSLKSLSFPAAFQPEDEGSIPFTRSNVFNDLAGVYAWYCIKPGCCFVSWRSDLRLHSMPRRAVAAAWIHHGQGRNSITYPCNESAQVSLNKLVVPLGLADQLVVCCVLEYLS